MSGDEELLSIYNSVRDNEVQLETRIQELEDENVELKELNSSYKNEIRQKNAMLSKAEKERNEIKAQYDELLERFRKLSKLDETQLDEESNDDTIISLRKQVQKITMRKEYYKRELAKSEAALMSLRRETQVTRNRKESDDALSKLEEMLSEYCPSVGGAQQGRSRTECIMSAVKETLKAAEQSDNNYNKYKRIKERHKVMLTRFKDMCSTILQTQSAIKSALQNQQRNRINLEIEKMINFINQYETKSSSIGDIHS